MGYDENARQAALKLQAANDALRELRNLVDYPWLTDRLDAMRDDVAQMTDEVREFRSAIPPRCLCCGMADYGPLCPSCDPGFAEGAADEMAAELEADMQLTELPILGWMTTDEGEPNRVFAVRIES